MSKTQDLEHALAPVVENAGLFLEGVTVKSAGKRSVVAVVVDIIDGPGAVTSDQLGEVSRAISTAMDQLKEAPRGAYTLEVTTPGATRELTDLRHFRRAEGRLVNLTLADTIALSDVSQARMDIEFSR